MFSQKTRGARHETVRILFFATASLVPTLVFAEQRIEVTRADGAKTPLLVYDTQGASGCAPLVLLSHGAGGSEEHGLRYLGEALAHDGWRAISIGHRESGLAPLRKDVQTAGVKQGIRDLITDVTRTRRASWISMRR